jgi:hypothetical protein
MAANATATVAAPINTSTISRRQCQNHALPPLFIEGRFSLD